ncbi:hypothetical protein DYB35_013066 [Aphanomyces astaci]|uniref:Uncharacterized protein n=1 Tax=Aphanomyces astaci TaxID=112090 RepID=A0A418CV30_APHAT|nr:hypothetical protein DYB35_013066 [Aphanomyces astaci]
MISPGSTVTRHVLIDLRFETLVLLYLLPLAAEVRRTGVWSRGSLDTLLQFSKAHRKLETIDWEAVEWRLKDRATYDVLLHFVREHFVYTDVMWQFSFFFNDQVAMAELLHRRLSAYEVGPGLSLPKLLPLAVFNNTDGRLVANITCLELAEYTPLIFRRTHGG